MIFQPRNAIQTEAGLVDSKSIYDLEEFLNEIVKKEVTNLDIKCSASKTQKEKIKCPLESGGH